MRGAPSGIKTALTEDILTGPFAPWVHSIVSYSTPLDGLTPDALVGTAVAPFVVAMLLRVLLGKSQFTRWNVALSTMWFAINVLLAPYSAGVRENLVELSNHFR